MARQDRRGPPFANRKPGTVGARRKEHQTGLIRLKSGARGNPRNFRFRAQTRTERPPASRPRTQKEASAAARRMVESLRGVVDADEEQLLQRQQAKNRNKKRPLHFVAGEQDGEQEQEAEVKEATAQVPLCNGSDLYLHPPEKTAAKMPEEKKSDDEEDDESPKAVPRGTNLAITKEDRIKGPHHPRESKKCFPLPKSHHHHPNNDHEEHPAETMMTECFSVGRRVPDDAKLPVGPAASPEPRHVEGLGMRPTSPVGPLMSPGRLTSQEEQMAPRDHLTIAKRPTEEDHKKPEEEKNKRDSAGSRKPPPGKAIVAEDQADASNKELPKDARSSQKEVDEPEEMSKALSPAPESFARIQSAGEAPTFSQQHEASAPQAEGSAGTLSSQQQSAAPSPNATELSGTAQMLLTVLFFVPLMLLAYWLGRAEVRREGRHSQAELERAIRQFPQSPEEYNARRLADYDVSGRWRRFNHFAIGFLILDVLGLMAFVLWRRKMKAKISQRKEWGFLLFTMAALLSGLNWGIKQWRDSSSDAASRSYRVTYVGGSGVGDSNFWTRAAILFVSFLMFGFLIGAYQAWAKFHHGNDVHHHHDEGVSPPQGGGGYSGAEGTVSVEVPR